MDRWRFSGASSSDTADDGAAVEMWRRPESVWMEYVFEWNPLLAEVEAVEACEWLREAGFPQYAQMYKDNQFPIDLKAAEKDHEFLDDDAIQAFFRRLDVLNKCSSLKLKRSPAKKNSYDSDDEEECALSNKWTFQRNSRLWSRNEANLIQAIPHLSIQPDLPVNGHLHSTSSRESVLDDVLEKLSSVSAPSCALLPSGGENGTAAGVCSEVWNDPVVSNRGFSRNGAAEISKATKLKRPNLFLAPLSSGIDKQDGIISKKVDERLQLNKNKDDVFHNTNNLKLLVNTIHKSDPIQSRNLSDSETISCGSGSPSGDQQKVTIEKVRGPLGIFRRMEGLTTRKSVRKLSKSDLTKKDIGTPVLVESPEILTKIGSLQCMDVGPASENAKCCGQSTIIGVQNSDIQRTPSEDRQILPGAPLLHSLNIPRIAEKHLKCNGDTPQQTLQQNRGICEDRDSLSDSRRCIVGVESPSASEVSSSKDLEDTIDIISELLHTVNLEMSTAKNSRKRISIYDNVSSEVCSVLQNELDALLGELYKNIDSLDYSMSKVTSNQRVESSTSSIGPVGEEDSFKASPTVPPKEHLIAKDSLGSCDSTDGNSSTTPSEGSYSLESAAARHRSTIGRLIEAASAVDHSVSEEAFQLTEDSKCIQTPVEIQSDPDSEDSVEQTAADDWSYPNRGGARERRDSGVGSSLTRTASSRRQKRARLRWHSFAKSHQITLNSYDQPISNLSAGLLAVLRKLSLLKVTAALEKYSPVSRNNWSWFVPRLRRRSKMPDYSERNVFGIPVSVTERRHGQPLPQCILYAMRHLRRSAGVTVGMFRRPGVKMRVQTLRIALETDPDAIDFDGLHAYDVADLLKLYFRELPECLLTNKLSNVFISIFLYIPEDLRRDLIRMTLLLLPDENRLVLQSLLLFLNDIAQHSQLNQMNASNLAVCFAPSLFHLCGAISSLASSPKQLHRRFPAPSEKDLVEQKVAHECLAYMIANVKSVFTVSEEMLSMCKLSYMEHGNPISLEALCRKYGKCDTGNYTAYVDSCIQGVLKESREKFKGWISYSASRGDVDLAYKKVGDGHPLRLWKFCVEVEAPPEEVLNRIMRERHLWDEDILKWRSVEKLDTQTEIFQYVLNSMVPHPTRDFSELRSWRTNLSRGTCVLISTSVEHANARLMGDVRGVVLASRYLIEPCGSGKSRLTHIIRIDLRGHSPDWYNSVYGYICANYARRIRDSFKNSIDLTSGPETKV